MNVTLRRSIAAAVVLAAPVLSSCGFNEPTDRVYNPAVGVNDRSGSVDVLGAVIVSGSKGTGTVSATLVNNDPQNADAVSRIAGSGKSSGVSVRLPGRVELKPGGTTKLSSSTAVVAKGAAVKPGYFVTLTFSFQRARNVTLDVPVVSRRGDFANVPESSPTSSTTSATPSESPTQSPSPSRTPRPRG